MTTSEKTYMTDKATHAVVILASRLMTKMKGSDMLDVIEESMTMLNYDGDACLDDIADAVQQMIANNKETINDATLVEKKQLKEAERKMNTLAKGIIFSQNTFDEDSWNPEPTPTNTEWLNTLDAIDSLYHKQEKLVQ